MKVMVRQLFLMSLVLVLCVTVFAACTTKKAEPAASNSNTDSQASNSPVENKYTAPFKNGKFDPPVTMTLVRPEKADLTFKKGENIKDNVHTRWVKENLGIELVHLWTTAASGGADAFNTKLRLMLSANEKMPDIIPITDMVLAGELIDSGKFMDVGDLFEKYASNSFKKAISEDPSVWYPVIRNGKKYGLPTLQPTGNGENVLYIRTDWLKNLKMEPPKTVDELEKVMDAFVNKDPDGNGKKDTYGMTIGLKNSFTSDFTNASWLFGAYGALPAQWNDFYGDGTLKYGSVQPQIKDGLAKLKDWMDKGYLPKEVGLWDATKSTELFTSGQAGIIPGPLWMPFWPLPDLIKNIPNAKYDAYPIPVGPTGKAMRTGSLNSAGVVLISKEMKHPDALFVYLNNLYDNYADPDSTSDMAYGLAEGYDWMKKDGKILIEGQMDKFHRVLGYTITGNGVNFPSAYLKTLSALADGKKPETKFEINKSGIPFKSLVAGKIVLSQADITKREQFIGAPTPTMKSRGNSLQSLEKETFSKIIYGELPLNEFDKFVEKWTTSGGDQMTKEVNDWYNSVKK